LHSLRMDELEPRDLSTYDDKWGLIDTTVREICKLDKLIIGAFQLLGSRKRRRQVPQKKSGAVDISWPQVSNPKIPGPVAGARVDPSREKEGSDSEVKKSEESGS
jgi:hypothetical protein